MFVLCVAVLVWFVYVFLSLSFSALDALAALLENEKKGIRKEACWTISNITAGKHKVSLVQTLSDTKYLRRAPTY